jgi:acetyl-CoA/propionyl-CoA carboxylase, biotin carboxylase, biotin carboxyl carrier protein
VRFPGAGTAPGTVLVANRGEIAVRVIRACRELGLRTVAVYSDADAGALHVRLADEGRRIGPAAASASYLDVDALLGAAKAAGAHAVHPGYGLLSEDAGFASAVTDAGLVFVGPPARVIATMGDKVAARRIAASLGVTIVAGSDASIGAAGVSEVAERIGWPVVVKASFGGGGRGMRVVTDASGLADALAGAARESRAAFGRSELHLERYLPRPRHVEVQVLGDAHGTVLHLGDRDCSVQRRHQKLIEEAPAPDLPPGLRSALHDAALRIARSVEYQGAGTVEFLVLPATGEFFFLEMNPRLQVEHGVSELVTGIDLVAAQLRLAAGERLWFGQDDVRIDGHAVQARIAAEDPAHEFRPAPGVVHELVLPQGPWLRNDMGIAGGDAVPAEYDSMFGKVLAWGVDRDIARRRLIGALDELRVVGIPTTAGYLRGVLASESFTAATHDTGSVARDWPPGATTAPERPGAAELTTSRGPAAAEAPRVRRVRIATDRGPVVIAVHGRAGPAPATGRPVGARPSRNQDGPGSLSAGPGSPAVAPMDATVVSVAVTAGQQVGAGDLLAVLEAMKMEIEVRSEAAGTVAEVLVAVGRPITAGLPLVRLAE